jgi:hypothetical protein
VVEVVIEGRQLDVTESTGMSFNFGIADIRHPDKRTTSYTKTIVCPSTPRNDELFGHIYDVNMTNLNDPTAVNIEVNFNPNKKATAIVMADGITVMKGSLQLRKVVQVRSAYRYEVVFIGELVNIFAELGSKKIGGFESVDGERVPYLDYSAYDHIFNMDNVEASWPAPYGVGYVYPYIDYGIEIDYGTLTPQGGTVPSQSGVIHLMEMRPAIYVKELIDKIFEYAGFTYTSTFFDHAFFSRLILPFDGSGRSATQESLDEAHVIAQANGTEQIQFIPSNTRHVEFDDVLDPANQWDETLDQFQAASQSSWYNVDVTVEYELTRITLPIEQNLPASTIKIWRVDDPSSINFAHIMAEVEFDWVIPDAVIGATATTTINLSALNIWCPVGWYIYVTVEIGSAVQSILFQGNDVFQTTNTIIELNALPDIFPDQNIVMWSMLPDIKMKDVLMNVVKMFNLYVLPDLNSDNNLIIETRDDFYEGGVVKDWTKKIDHDSPIEVEPMALLTAKEYIYAYAEDDDYYNNLYQDHHGLTYGSARLRVNNDFLQNQKEHGVTFSPTPLVNDGVSNRIIPKIWDSNVDDGPKATEHNVRILYYSGLIDSVPNWRLFNHGYGLSDYNESRPYSTYPYAGHLTHPTAPAQDLNFGVLNELFYSQNANTGQLLITNDNLFNRYHRRGFLEITDKDSKVMTAKFYLEPLDIARLDFRDQIVVDNSYWRLNRVIDYNPFSEGLTTVELLKVLDKEPLEVDTLAVGTVGTMRMADVEVGAPYPIRHERFPRAQGKSIGIGNRIAADVRQFMVHGNGNMIGEASYNIMIQGDDNHVAAGVHNVNIINSSDQSVTESNVTIIDGKVAKAWTEVSTAIDYTPSDREVVLVDASGGAIAITMTMTDNFWINVKKIDGSANAVTITSVSGTIDGAASQTLTSQYDAIGIYADGTNAHIR